MRIAFRTFGCKINQYETDGMRQAAVDGGNTLVPFEGDADVYVINTCSVTAKSDYQCRQAIRAAARRGAGARIIVTGCYAETRGDEVRKIPGVSLVIPSRDKLDLPRFLSDHETSAPAISHVLSPAPATRTRAFLKIQDGCDNRCTYCIVPLARGSSRSVPVDAVIRLFDEAVSRNAPEIVLSGIHIGRYGSDLAAATSLTALVQELVMRRNNARVRLSSLEPNELTPEIIAMLGKGLCRHLHLPLQSGDDGILRKMNRHYTVAFYRELVERVAAQVPDVAIGADVMVGFPGEGEKEFRNTYELIEALPLSHLHVFSYSARPGTPAASMPRQVKESDKRSRNESLRILGMKKNLMFRKGLLDKNFPVVVETREDTHGRSIGMTDNYVKVAVKGAVERASGSIVTVRIDAVTNDVTEGSMLQQTDLL